MKKRGGRNTRRQTKKEMTATVTKQKKLTLPPSLWQVSVDTLGTGGAEGGGGGKEGEDERGPRGRGPGWGGGKSVSGALRGSDRF